MFLNQDRNIRGICLQFTLCHTYSRKHCIYLCHKKMSNAPHFYYRHLKNGHKCDFLGGVLKNDELYLF